MADSPAVKEGTVIQQTAFERFALNLQARAREVKKDKNRGSEIIKGQAENILTANTVDEVWEADEGGTVSGQAFVDVPCDILSYELSPSNDEYVSDLDVYVNCRVVVIEAAKEWHPGDEVIVNVGGTLIVTKLEKFRSMPNAFPLKGVVFRQYGRVLKLRRVGDRAIPVSTTED